ncbi:Bgt-20600 [Blumeria graminis f. sp. tritici]|uniref:Bgt-20600 n=1 Tax=Blumeria graminis f. sp. tritici TaxID=62690 RepID=A0A9X9MIZ2_BLUGR|nr:Bgt-20600 [Blumeria graminis f. sp. tritici]
MNTSFRQLRLLYYLATPVKSFSTNCISGIDKKSCIQIEV